MPRKRQKILLSDLEGNVYEMGPKNMLLMLADALALEEEVNWTEYAKYIGQIEVHNASSSDLIDYIKTRNS